MKSFFFHITRHKKFQTVRHTIVVTVGLPTWAAAAALIDKRPAQRKASVVVVTVRLEDHEHGSTG